MSTPIGGDLHGYYRLHAPIYDLTRPFFLFGRGALVRRLARHWQAHGTPELAPRILEIGCGTGSNLALMGRLLPTAQLVGVDLALPMLERARKRLGNRAQLLHGALGEVDTGRPFDLVLASYMLSMTGPALHDCIRSAKAALAPGGVFGVVDFERSGSDWFARWMQRNHVNMDGQLSSALEQQLRPLEITRKRAMLGAWTFVQWLGQAK